MRLFSIIVREQRRRFARPRPSVTKVVSDRSRASVMPGLTGGGRGGCSLSFLDTYAELKRQEGLHTLLKPATISPHRLRPLVIAGLMVNETNAGLTQMSNDYFDQAFAAIVPPRSAAATRAWLGGRLPGDPAAPSSTCSGL